MLFDEVQVFDPKASEPAPQSPKRSNSKSVSVSSLSKVLKSEQDPRKRELLSLVLEWLDVKAVAKRGGFVASGEEQNAVTEYNSGVHDGITTVGRVTW